MQVLTELPLSIEGSLETAKRGARAALIRDHCFGKPLLWRKLPILYFFIYQKNSGATNTRLAFASDSRGLLLRTKLTKENRTLSLGKAFNDLVPPVAHQRTHFKL